MFCADSSWIQTLIQVSCNYRLNWLVCWHIEVSLPAGSLSRREQACFWPGILPWHQSEFGSGRLHLIE